jgi:nicotinate-nucleotide--dimethylbenzimidazole phosphoribosyltransferase
MSEFPKWVTAVLPRPDLSAEMRARERQARLTKPAGSLGQLEELAVRLASLGGTDKPGIVAPHILIFAGDHGITEEGVSAYPSEVTGQMLTNFVSGGAAISVLAREQGATLQVIDTGTLLRSAPAGVHMDKVAHGTRNFRREEALTEEELFHALRAGRDAATRAINDGADLLILGEMGIGNTSSATAIAAALLDGDVAALAGAGTGLTGDGISHKTRVITESLTFHELAGGGAVAADTLRKVGGHEIAALAGAAITAAQESVPVLVDGFICSAAMLAAVNANPALRDWLLFSHRSTENGHAAILTALNADPLFDLGLRLGEGSGAALALPLLRLACTLHNEMATFDSAGVSSIS